MVYVDKVPSKRGGGGMVSAKCAKRKYSYLLPTTPVLRLEGSRTLLEFLHRIHFHVHFQPHLQVASFPPPTCPISTGGGQVFYLDAKTLAPPTTKQFTPYLTLFVPTTRTNFFRYSSRHYMYCRAGQGSYTVRLVQYLLSDGIRQSPVRMASCRTLDRIPFLACTPNSGAAKGQGMLEC